MTLPSEKRITASSYATYEDDVVYTVYFTQLQYVPLSGFMKIILPDAIEITENPYDSFSSTSAGYQKWPQATDGYGEETCNDVNSYQYDNTCTGTQKYIKFKAV